MLVLQRGDMLSILNFCHYMYLPVGANGMIDLGVLSVTTYIHGSTVLILAFSKALFKEYPSCAPSYIE
ncbi:uncharacterized protein LAJ45_02770 [Morchella importuna]|uniref:uncharacterized protein n=1 Tax=Morchella importuna TaxID=1174673 RepID=UPI001E8ED069|nr:uncharacterized protein LAJ45_02770 [Morchella importuna]KAH8153183.1 hypothetical protein LAJ45_02770 [Morchella importuna]